jgi:sulfate adenylyltransferase
MSSADTAVRRRGHIVAPHGGELVDRTVAGDEAAALAEEAAGLPRVRMTEKQTADLDMIASGALSPLTGFMTRADYDPVVESMRLDSGLPWALPVTLSVPEAPRAERLALEGYEGALLAVIDVAEVFEADRRHEAARVYRTTEDAHPGVAQIYAEGSVLVGGPVTVFQRPEPGFPALHMDPVKTRAAIAERGWHRVVGFQTRNPVHRAHEYIQKCALEAVDGLLLHPLVGKTKGDDVPAEVRVRCYEVLLEQYYPADRTLLAAFPAAMRYAGPREAIWHAICRKNYGCSHFIVGRDHAGVGNYYGTYDAQLIFDEFEEGELGIQPMFFEHSFFCRACGNMGTAKTCPHSPEDHVHLSGTKVREMLGRGEMPPPEFSRPEVAQVLIDAYRSAPTA